MRIVIAALVVLMLSGCVSTSVNEFFTVDTAPTGTTPASNTDTYPEINNVPVGETQQLSSAQTAAEKRELASAASKGRVQATNNNQASYAREIAELRRLALQQQQRRAASLKAASE